MPVETTDTITLRDLYPELTQDQFQEAQENLDRCIDLSLRMFERILRDPAAWLRFEALTAEKTSATLKKPS
jgi:hypothetical protein